MLICIIFKFYIVCNMKTWHWYVLIWADKLFWTLSTYLPTEPYKLLYIINFKKKGLNSIYNRKTNWKNWDIFRHSWVTGIKFFFRHHCSAYSVYDSFWYSASMGKFCMKVLERGATSTTRPRVMCLLSGLH